MDAILDEDEEKRAFAMLCIQFPNEPFKAALQLFPSNTNRALRVATEWPKDSLVKETISQIYEQCGEFAGLAGKADLARDVWQRMQGIVLDDGTVIRPNSEDYVKLAKLYADIRGFIEKPSTSVTVNNAIAGNVIEVPVYDNDEDWEKDVQQQQQELLNVSRTRH